MAALRDRSTSHPLSLQLISIIIRLIISCHRCMFDCICLDIENVVLEEREYLFFIFVSSLRLIWSDSIRCRRQFSTLLVLFERKGFFN